MKNKYAIVYACDKNFLFTFCTSLLSIKKYSPATLNNTDIILYYSGLNSEDIELINKIHHVTCIEYKFPLDINQQDENFKKYTQLAYARYEIFSMLKTYEKVLYIDVDTMITNDLTYIFNNYCNENGIAFSIDAQKGLSKISKNFKQPLKEYDMEILGLNSGVILFSNNIKNPEEVKDWCYKQTVAMLDNLICPDQGILNIMLQHFNIKHDVLPDICNCLPGSKRYLNKADKSVIIYHCAGGGVRFWRYSYDNRWEELYKEYLSLGGSEYVNNDKPWRKLIKKYKLYRFDFFNRSPNPNVHTYKFIVYVLTYPFYKIKQKLSK